jgi:uncharacterized LabA/DUF88 family protein
VFNFTFSFLFNSSFNSFFKILYKRSKIMRAAIFIDGGYLLKQLQDARITPDYKVMADHFLAPLRDKIPLDLLRCYFYYCPPWMSQTPSDDEKRRMAGHEKFVVELESLNRWKFREGVLERRFQGDKEVYSQKRVDVLLSVDMVRHAAAGHIQHAVLVAGDSDFIPAVIAAKESGVTLTLWCATDRSPHKDLMREADEIRYLDWKKFPKVTSKPEPATKGVEKEAKPARNALAATPAVPKENTSSSATVKSTVDKSTADKTTGSSRSRRGRR